jgi:hypothetical protein
MATDPKKNAHQQNVPLWYRAGQFLFYAALAAAFILLALSMMHHRFVQGSRVDRYGHIRQ